MAFSRLKTTTRVGLTLAVVTALLAVLAAASVSRMNALATQIDAISGARLPQLALATELSALLAQNDERIRTVLAGGSAAAQGAALERDVERMTELARRLRAGSDDARAGAMHALAEAASAYEPLATQLVRRVSAAQPDEARALASGPLGEAHRRYTEALGAFARGEASAIEGDAGVAREAHRRSTRLMLALAAATAVACCIGAWVIIGGIRNGFGPRSYAARLARAIAGGDLTQEVRVTHGDDAAILGAMREMRAQLANAVAAIRRSARSLNAASERIALGSAEVSRRTEEQASSLEETAASVEELASAVRHNAENARQADELARAASERAENGGAQVRRVVEQMKAIGLQSAHIGDIVALIDGIAFQTNILALNAAVEAARAGEQGRGFAVVAGEVRTLAQRSAEAAKEIRALVAESVERMQSGQELVGHAGATIETLVSDVKRVGDLMRAIAEASAEQSRGVQQVNVAVTAMDKGVQRNAAAAQDTHAEAAALRGQAEALVAAVSAFRVKSEERVDADAQPAVREAGAWRHALAETSRRALPEGAGTP